jgi:hypothetical protein
MRSDGWKPSRTQPRPGGAVRLWVEQLDCRCLPSGGSPDVSSFLVVGPGTGLATEDQLGVIQPPPLPVWPVLPTPSDGAGGGNVFLPPLPVIVHPEPMPLPDGGGGGPMGGPGVFPGPTIEPVSEVVTGPGKSYLPLLLPATAFDGPLFALPEHAVAGRTATVDWGDGVNTDAVFAPAVDGWLAVRVNRVLDENATYNVNVRLTAADDPTDWLDIPLQVQTPPAPPTDGPTTWNATGYLPPVPVEVTPSEQLWVALPVFESAGPEPSRPGGSDGFTPLPPAPPPSEPTDSPTQGPGPDVTQFPPPDVGPAPPTNPPATPSEPFTSPPGGAAAPINPPVVHPASYAPFEAGPVRASAPTAPLRTPPPDPIAARADTRPAGSGREEKTKADPSPVAGSTPADQPEQWDWVVALGVSPFELAAVPAHDRAARASRSEGTSDDGVKDRDRPPPAAPANTRGQRAPRDAAPSDTATADLWTPPPDADRRHNLADASIVRQTAPSRAGESPEAILAALADAPAPDAVFADVPAAAESPEGRREPWGWQSKAMALAAAVWTGVWFLWPRLGQWARLVDPATAAPDALTPTRAEVARPPAPRSAELTVEPVARS